MSWTHFGPGHIRATSLHLKTFLGNSDLFYWMELILSLHAPECEQVLLVPEEEGPVPRRLLNRFLLAPIRVTVGESSMSRAYAIQGGRCTLGKRLRGRAGDKHFVCFVGIRDVDSGGC